MALKEKLEGEMVKVALIILESIIGKVESQGIYDSFGKLIGSLDWVRIYHGSGNERGIIVEENLYGSSRRLLGRLDRDRIFDESGRKTGRLKGLKRM